MSGIKNRMTAKTINSPTTTTTTTTSTTANTIIDNVPITNINNNNNKKSFMKFELRSVICFSLFLFSGVANTLLVQLIYNNISFNPKSMLTNICIFLGYAFLKLFDDPTNKVNKDNNNNSTSATTTTTSTSNHPTSPNATIQLNSSSSSSVVNNNKKQNFSHIKYILLAILDCLASLLTTIGQIAVGSGLFQVLFSSKIIFAAILSKLYLKSFVSKQKWISIFTIFFGLCITVYKVSSPSLNDDHNHDGIDIEINNNNNNNSNNNSYIYFGTFCVLFAAFIFSASHIYAESIIKQYDMKPFTFASRYGIYSVIVCILYICSVTFYNRKEWIETPIGNTPNNDIILVIFLFLILMITSVVRSSSMYTVLAEHGTVSMGVLYALQSIIVFLTSAFFLCDPSHPIKQNQCLTTPKLLGSSIVILGVFMYNSANSIKQPQHVKV